jgi:hypothetical protein
MGLGVLYHGAVMRIHEAPVELYRMKGERFELNGSRSGVWCRGRPRQEFMVVVDTDGSKRCVPLQ